MIGAFSAGHWLLAAAVACLLFGAGFFPRLCADAARGLKSIRQEFRS